MQRRARGGCVSCDLRRRVHPRHSRLACAAPRAGRRHVVAVIGTRWTVRHAHAQMCQAHSHRLTVGRWRVAEFAYLYDTDRPRKSGKDSPPARKQGPGRAYAAVARNSFRRCALCALFESPRLPIPAPLHMATCPSPCGTPLRPLLHPPPWGWSSLFKAYRFFFFLLVAKPSNVAFRAYTTSFIINTTSMLQRLQRPHHPAFAATAPVSPTATVQSQPHY